MLLLASSYNSLSTASSSICWWHFFKIYASNTIYNIYITGAMHVGGQYLLLLWFRIEDIASELEIWFICAKRHCQKNNSQRGPLFLTPKLHACSPTQSTLMPALTTLQHYATVMILSDTICFVVCFTRLYPLSLFFFGLHDTSVSSVLRKGT